MSINAPNKNKRRDKKKQFYRKVHKLIDDIVTIQKTIRREIQNKVVGLLRENYINNNEKWLKDLCNNNNLKVLKNTSNTKG